MFSFSHAYGRAKHSGRKAQAVGAIVGVAGVVGFSGVGAVLTSPPTTASAHHCYDHVPGWWNHRIVDNRTQHRFRNPYTGDSRWDFSDNARICF